ncbi:class II glutamine amidotransferase [Puerhibacterium puerhi]|uniref:class II glutamine amidotransferase n=1 Tax=Puerhibacterium puerhi TaxID=2692623 RepID=UPI001915B462|nr:class II glutamine amidotransferase [Puerhibacterium puerhi]
MCRWMAYSGDPVPAEALLFRPKHSLIDQSLHSELGATTTNGDGFGIGWYTDGDEPLVFKEIDPAWNNRNLREISREVKARMFFAHIRSATGTAVQQTNCHPFRHGRWLWMHNGMIAGFHEIKRDLMMAVDPELFGDIEGSTDSEMLFFLAMTFGLKEDPVPAVQRAVGFVEDTAARHDVVNPVQMTVATTDGDAMWAFRYSSEGRSRSLFYSTRVDTLLELHPEVEVLHELSAETRFVVSEPLRDLAGAWNGVPESSWGMVGPGRAEIGTFRPVSTAA